MISINTFRINIFFTVALNRRLNRLFSGHQCTYTYTHNMCNMAPLDIPLFQFRAKHIYKKSH